jgi:hypothetical protein
VRRRSLSDDRLVILDRQSGQIRFFSPEGEFLMSVGSKGGGPGEFQSASGLRVLPGDTLEVWDENAYRTTWFGPDGELIDTESMNRGALPIMTRPPRHVPPPVMLPDGDYLLREIRGLSPMDEAPTDGPERHPQVLVRGSADLARWDTLMVYGGVEHVAVTASARTDLLMKCF